MTTYATFQAQIRRQLEEATANVWADPALMWHTNRVIQDISRRSKPMRDEEYMTVTVGTPDYELPARTLSVIAAIWHGTDGTRTRLRREALDFLIENNDGTNGVPNSFAVDDDQIYIYPEPATTGTLRLWRYTYPAEITATTDTLPYAGYEEVMEYGVLERCFQQINDYESASYYRNKFEEAVGSMAAQKMTEDSALISSAPVEVF